MNRMIAGALKLGPLPAVIAGQAALLAWLGVVLDRDAWPADNPVVLVPFITVVFGWPVLVLFAAEPGSFKRTAAFAGVCAVVAGLLGTYVGWQATPGGKFSVGNLYSIYVATQLGAGFIALAFMQQITARAPFRYAALFKSAWRNLFVAGLSLALVGGVAILLALWAALFAILGIDALGETFTEPWFVLPAAGIVFGVGTMLFRRRDRLIDGIVGLVESLGRYLLPVVLLIVAVFLVTLPFVSVGALWDTGLGSRILIALGTIAMLLIGIAYRPEADLRYPGSVQLAVTAVVVVLPILPALAMTGILIRVNQYGWTVSRCWAFSFAGLLALFSLGYLWGVIRHLAEWPRVTALVNLSMACVILAVLLLQNTPVLDFRAISARSQLARVESGKIGLEQFDFRYVARELARPGYLAAHRLLGDAVATRDERDEEDGIVPFAAEDALETIQSGGGAILRRSPDDVPDRDFWAEVSYRPAPFDVPDGVREAIDREAYIAYRVEQPILVRAELDGDSERTEFLLLGMHRNEFPGLDGVIPPHISFSPLAYAIVDPGDGWEFVMLWPGEGRIPSEDPETVLEVLRSAPIIPSRPRYDHVKIGDTVYALPARDWSSAETPSSPSADP
ncbi:MAG: DUF4153 domain-containing protein [Gammaproteobacteria bacterium]|nr:DUF4153 domain-containing protein [Gammaproteobacteria bacterium]